MLVLTGVLPREALDVHAPGTVAALCIDAGDDANRCRASVGTGWATLQQPRRRYGQMMHHLLTSHIL